MIERTTRILRLVCRRCKAKMEVPVKDYGKVFCPKCGGREFISADKEVITK